MRQAGQRMYCLFGRLPWQLSDVPNVSHGVRSACGEDVAPVRIKLQTSGELTVESMMSYGVTTPELGWGNWVQAVGLPGCKLVNGLVSGSFELLNHQPSSGTMSVKDNVRNDRAENFPFLVSLCTVSVVERKIKNAGNAEKVDKTAHQTYAQKILIIGVRGMNRKSAVTRCCFRSVAYLLFSAMCNRLENPAIRILLLARKNKRAHIWFCTAGLRFGQTPVLK
jgi:hypothetical protein